MRTTGLWSKCAALQGSRPTAIHTSTLQTQSQTTGSVRSDAAGSDPVVTVVSRGSATAPSAKWQVECGVGSVAQWARTASIYAAAVNLCE